LSQSAICSKCQLQKPLVDFPKDARNKSGHRGKCKSCYAEYMRDWSRKNSKSVNARVLRYHKKNKQELNLKRKIRAQRNIEQTNLTRKKWAEKNPDKVSASRVKMLHKRRNNIRENNFLISIKEVMKLKEKPCIYCGSQKRITLDHVVPLSRGGRNSIGNLVPACLSCNCSKGYKLLMEWRLFKLKVKEKK